MSLATPTSALRALQERGLLAENQFLKAVSHPGLPELGAHPDAQATLAWLLRNDIVHAHALLEATDRHRAALDDGAQGTRRSLVVATLRQINQDSVDALLAEALITPDIHQLVSAALKTDRMLTPADTMELVMAADMMPQDHYAALQARPASERSAAANAILADSALMIPQPGETDQRPSPDQLFPGPRWLYIAAVPLMIGAFFWYNHAASLIPDCASDQARKGLAADGLIKTLTSRYSPDGSAPSISDVREVGYNKVREVRGCSSNIRLDKDIQPFAYVIARHPDPQQGGFVVESTPPEIVAARFGATGADGDFIHNAAPLGRSAVTDALRAGVAVRINTPENRQVAEMMRNLATMRRQVGIANPDDGVEQQPVGAIEPTGECRALKPGEGYACPLLFAWNDPMIKILGRQSQILRGDFTFVPNEAGATPAWRVSASFTEEFDRARQAAYDDKPAPDATAPAAK